MPKSEFMARWYNGRISAVYDERQSPGNIFFVSSDTGTDGTAYGGSPEKPFATLAYAVAAATDDQGDLIILMPGHEETYATAASLTIDVDNLTILGVGNGALMPSFTFDGGGVTAGVDIDITADNVTIQHVWFNNTEDGATAPIDVAGAYLTIRDCYFHDDGTDNTVAWIDLAATADFCTIEDCFNYGTDTAGNTTWVTAAACDKLRISNVHSHGNFSSGNITFTAAATDMRISGCHLENPHANDVNITCFAGVTGWIDNNMCQIPTDAQVTWITVPGNSYAFENYGCNQPGETGKLIIAAGVSA